jgi:hypothetical protein
MRALVAVVAAGALLSSQLVLVELHRPDGSPILINPKQVTSLREPQAGGHFAKGTRCLIYLTNGNFVTVRETCTEAVRLLAHPLIEPEP